MIVIDTSAVYAAIDTDDARHALALTGWKAARGRQDLVIPNYVVSETLSLTSRRLGMGAAREAQRFMALASPLWVSPVEHAIAVRDFLDSGRGLSFVDCATFALMRTRGISTAFAFDRDFVRAGFDVIPT